MRSSDEPGRFIRFFNKAPDLFLSRQAGLARRVSFLLTYRIGFPKVLCRKTPFTFSQRTEAMAAGDAVIGAHRQIRNTTLGGRAMWSKLMPAEIGFYDLFTSHARAMSTGAHVFVEILEGWPERTKIERIFEIEHECDTFTRMAIDLLHRTFITPLDRVEIVGLASTLDDVVDGIHVAARRLELFEIDRVPPAMLDLARVLDRASAVVADMVAIVKDFKRMDEQRERFEQLHALENEGDRIFHGALADLFKTYKHDPLYVIKLKEIYDTIEQAIDRCEDIADIVEGILLEHA